MKPTICRCCGEPMPVQTEGNVNMCETCKCMIDSAKDISIDNVFNRLNACLKANYDTMETALKCIDDGNYHLAHVVLRDQLEKLNYVKPTTTTKQHTQAS